MSDENLGENDSSHCRHLAHVSGSRNGLLNRERLHGLVHQNPARRNHGQWEANKWMAP